MIFISHRGNIDGKNPEKENYPEYITGALSMGYEVEIDVWYKDKKFFLGHDYPQYKIQKMFLNLTGLWVHAKNIEALYHVKDMCNCFFHDKDEAVLTSRNNIWTFPGGKVTPGSIINMCNEDSHDDIDLSMCYGICSDDIKKYKEALND